VRIRSRGRTYRARGWFLRPREVGVNTARRIAHIVAPIYGVALEIVGGGRGNATSSGGDRT
jgi:hypothetical protein